MLFSSLIFEDDFANFENEEYDIITTCYPFIVYIQNETKIFSFKNIALLHLMCKSVVLDFYAYVLQYLDFTILTDI